MGMSIQLTSLVEGTRAENRADNECESEPHRVGGATSPRDMDMNTSIVCDGVLCCQEQDLSH